jgi:uncharacterized protein (TIGR03437 family)
MSPRISLVSFLVIGLVAIPASADVQARPPVILVDGGGYNCATAPRTSTYSFGQLEQKLAAQGLSVNFFRPCDVPPGPAPLETVGQAIGKLIDSLGVPQVDVIAFGAGANMFRSYLAGKQLEPGVFNPPADPKVRKAIFIEAPHFGGDPATDMHKPDVQVIALWAGSRFLWDLNTWNQGTDDLRQVDALAIAGNLTDFDNEGLTLQSILPFGYTDERMRVVPLCIWRPYCSNQFVSYIDSDTHLSWRIISSFLNGTDEWKALGQTPSQDPVLSKNGGLMLAVKDASDQFIAMDQVSVNGLDMKKGNMAFFKHFIEKGDYTLQATAPVAIPSNTWGPALGGFSVVTMKPGPIIARATPSAGQVGTLSLAPGSFISVYGTRLGTGLNVARQLPLPTTLGATTVTINDKPIGLHFAGENQVNAVLPEDISGLVKMTVKTAEGSHSINILIEEAVPAIFTVSQTGSGPASALHAAEGGAVSDTSPARIGEYVSVYLTGLGSTEASGAVQVAKYKPEATVDGIAAKVDWAGRAPGYPGLDQVNIIIPAGVRTGTSVPLTIKSGKRVSNMTTLAIK